MAVWAFELRCRTVVLALAASLCLCRDASRRIANHGGGSQLMVVLPLHKELLDTWARESLKLLGTLATVAHL